MHYLMTGVPMLTGGPGGAVGQEVAAALIKEDLF